MRIAKLLALSLCLLVTLGACSTNSIEEIEQTCDATDVSYATDIVPIITTYCSPDFNSSVDFACHGAGALIGDWTEYTTVKLIAESGNLVNRTVTAANMPPGNSTGPQSLTNCEKEQIQSWVDAGALNN